MLRICNGTSVPLGIPANSAKQFRHVACVHIDRNTIVLFFSERRNAGACPHKDALRAPAQRYRRKSPPAVARSPGHRCGRRERRVVAFPYSPPTAGHDIEETCWPGIRAIPGQTSAHGKVCALGDRMRSEAHRVIEGNLHDRRLVVLAVVANDKLRSKLGVCRLDLRQGQRLHQVSAEGRAG